MYIWKLKRVEDIAGLVWIAKEAKFGHVLIKIADGTDISEGNITDLVTMLHLEGIQAFGWQYIYTGSVGEADIASLLCQQYELDGFIVNAEKQFDQAGMDEVARNYMIRLRLGLGNDFVVGLSSYRYPSLHSDFPWRAFIERCDLVMPQVYWIGETDFGAPERNLAKTLSEHKTLFSALKISRPIVFTGAAFSEHGWVATDNQVGEFLKRVDQLSVSETLVLPAVNFWEWWECRVENPSLWTIIHNYEWRYLPVSKFNTWANAMTDALRLLGYPIPDPPITIVPEPEQFQVNFVNTVNLRDKPSGSDIGDVKGIVTIQPPTQHAPYQGHWYEWGQVVDPARFSGGWVAIDLGERDM